jgi:dipeptidyl aminopeptidase/acylaminoacyl peptidase
MRTSHPLSRFVVAVLALLALAPTLAAPTRGAPVPQSGPGPGQVPRADPKPTIRQFLQIRTPGAPEILPDSSLLVRDWPAGVFQLYRVIPAQSANGLSYRPEDVTVQRLTNYPDGISSFTLSPDGKRVIVEYARGGNENTQLALLDPLAAPGTEPVPLYTDPKVQASLNIWLRDGSGFVYSANDESPNDFYLYRYDFAAGSATKLLGEPGQWSAVDVTRDGRRFLIRHDISASDIHDFELDPATGKRMEITIAPPGGTADCEIVGYMPDERSVLLLSDVKEGTKRLDLRDLKSGAVREPIPALGRFELDGAGLSDSREYLVAAANEDGYGVLSAYTLPDFKAVTLPPIARGVAMPQWFRGATLVWTLNNARTAGVAYAFTFVRGARGSVTVPPARQLTWTNTQGIDLGSFPLPELVRYPAFDGRTIPAFLFLPPGYEKGKPIPFIVNYHGGPEGQHRPTFSAVNQYFLSRGYGMILPNVRGSTGYGRDYQMLDNYKGRWDSVRDGVDAAEWLVRNGYAEPGRIATYGGSYGGFMSVACTVEDQLRVDRHERPARLFGACVDVVGIVNMKTFLEKTSGYRRKLREVEYGPLTDPAFLDSISSIRKVDEIRIPVFVAHGFNDPRVPVQEAMQLATALKEQGREPRLFIAPDEGHGFAKLDNRIYFYERMAQFLDETVGAGAAAQP